MRGLRLIFAALALGGAMFASHGFAQSGGRVALVIGNAKYPDSDTPLTTPVDDAKALSAELGKQGYAVKLGQNLGKSEMVALTEQMIGQVRPGAEVVVFFSGYGIQSGRQNFLIPIDSQIWTDADVQRNGLGLNRLLADIDKQGAARVFVILDAANRNPFERRFRSFSTGLAPLASVSGNVTVLYSTSPGSMLKGASGTRGPFTTELVKQISTAGGVTRDAFEATRTALASATNNDQVPWIFSTATAAPGVVAAVEPPKPAPAASQPSVASAPQPPVATAPQPKAQPQMKAPPPPSDASDFVVAQQTGTKQAYLDFLSRHKTGAYADLARSEIDRLSPPPPVSALPPPASISTPSRPEPPPTQPAAAAPGAPQSIGAPGPTQPPAVAPPAVQAAKAAPAKFVPLPYSADDGKLRDDLTAKIARDSADVAAIYTRGQLYALHNEFDRALADFDRVIRLEPQDPEALNNRCWVRALLDRLDDALVDCNAALKLRPNFVDALDSRGFVNLKIGLPTLAAADYDAVLKQNGRQASALYGRGLARLRLGDPARGNNDMKAALGINPAVAQDFAQSGVQ